jgi:hypothetical protein
MVSKQEREKTMQVLRYTNTIKESAQVINKTWTPFCWRENGKLVNGPQEGQAISWVSPEAMHKAGWNKRLANKTGWDDGWAVLHTGTFDEMEAARQVIKGIKGSGSHVCIGRCGEIKEVTTD